MKLPSLLTYTLVTSKAIHNSLDHCHDATPVAILMCFSLNTSPPTLPSRQDAPIAWETGIWPPYLLSCPVLCVPLAPAHRNILPGTPEWLWLCEGFEGGCCCCCWKVLRGEHTHSVSQATVSFNSPDPVSPFEPSSALPPSHTQAPRWTALKTPGGSKTWGSCFSGSLEKSC